MRGRTRWYERPPVAGDVALIAFAALAGGSAGLIDGSVAASSASLVVVTFIFLIASGTWGRR